MRKSIKILLGVAGVLALLGICFACLSIYAKKEINKPRFELSEIITEQPASPLPKTKEEAYDYVAKLYEANVTADDVEGSWHTDVHLTEGDKVTPFSDSDNAALSRVLENAQGALGALYPTSESVLMSKAEAAPILGFSKADVTDFTAEKGYVDEAGEVIDDGNYYITLTVNPACLDTKAMLEGDIRKNIEKELSSALTVSSLEIEPEGFTASFRIRYYNDSLVWTELKHNLKIKASADFSEAYWGLSKDTAELELPYESVESIDFNHYGIHFSERQFAVQKSDMRALPLEVTVNAETTEEDYTLKFEVSKDGILDIDKDGVMTVKNADKEPLTVKAILEYDGHIYTDELLVYATEWEVKTDEPNGN